ncbi:MAG TPA: DUF3857 domain-containing protein, partial [Bacteroidota bacterium]|nr:DUF3857 domain-containing protein [Bacteroidota bacterium]
MKRRRLQRYCCAALCIIAHCALAGSGRAGAKAEDDHAYDVRRIPPGIRVNSDAMIRENSVIFEVTNEQRATAYVTRVYTVFSREGRGFGQENLRYNSRFNKITNLEGTIFDENGVEVRTLESSDVKDESDIDAGMLYEDIRVRSAQLFFDRYPYSVRFTYREISDGYLAWPDWVAQPSDEPVEHTRFEVILPAGWPLRYWSGKDTLRPVEKTLEDGRRSFVWEER